MCTANSRMKIDVRLTKMFVLMYVEVRNKQSWQAQTSSWQKTLAGEAKNG